MNVAIWVVQGVIAAMFAMAGVIKLFQSKETLAPKMAWVEDFPFWVVRLIGLAELLGAVALIVPMLTGIVPLLTPLAAAALAFVMVLAGIYHVTQEEFKEVLFNVFLLVGCVVIAYFRADLLGPLGG